jgi:flagellar hook-associated protein 3
MRISNQLILNTYLERLEIIQNKLFKNWENITTGKQLLYPSDNPLTIVRALQLRTYLSEIKTSSQVGEHLSSFFNLYETTLSQIVDIGHRAQELAITGRNVYSNSEEMKEALISELNYLLDNLISIGNSIWENTYVYSGTATKTKTFEKEHLSIDPNAVLNSAGYQIPPTSGTITINGVPININVNVDTTNDILNRIMASIPGMTATYDSITDRITLTYPGNITIGSDTDTSNWLKAVKLYSGVNSITSTDPIGTDRVNFNGNSEIRNVNISGINFELNFVGSNQLNPLNRGVFIDVNKGINIFQAIIDVRDKIMGGNLDETTVNSLEKAVENAIEIYTLVGGKGKRLEALNTNNSDFEGVISKELSNIEDLDIAKGSIEYNTINYYYQVNLMVSARLFQNNLLNYLK